ncbi:MAG: histidine--tRNA ligase [Anaerolineales bacterium]|nr:histidine--tRNA ligase [Anaerolineales bacterium]
MKTTIPTVKGTRDFYPEEMAVRAWLLGKIRKVSEMYGYQEYEGPFLERLDLYAAKSGEELVNKQSYVFEDRGGDRITLRPELTPSLARMVAQRQNELAFPARWWMFGPFWRYERPQKGRTREFFQWNIDMLGANTPECDAEMIAIAVSLFRELGLPADKVRIAVNSRKLLNDELAALGMPEDLRKEVIHIIDRRDKLPPKDWEDYVLGTGITTGQMQGIYIMLKDEQLWQKSEELRRVFAVLDQMGMSEYVEFDPGVIRGLDYYTGVVFEAQARAGGRAIFGGGHYDNLISAVGGNQLPATGFAMGDVMITVLLKEYGLIPDLQLVPADVFITAFDEDSLADSFALSAELRAAGLKVVVYPEAVKLQKQLKFADRMGIRFVVIAGPDERAAGQVTVKDLLSRTQETVDRASAASAIRKMLAQAAPV